MQTKFLVFSVHDVYFCSQYGKYTALSDVMRYKIFDVANVALLLQIILH